MKNTKSHAKKMIGVRVPETLWKSADSMLRTDLAWKAGAATLLLATGYLAMREARKGSSTRKMMGYLAGPGSPAREFGAMMLGQAFDAAMEQWAKPQENGLSGIDRKRSKSKKRQPPAKVGKKTGKKTAVRQARTVRADNSVGAH